MLQCSRRKNETGKNKARRVPGFVVEKIKVCDGYPGECPISGRRAREVIPAAMWAWSRQFAVSAEACIGCDLTRRFCAAQQIGAARPDALLGRRDSHLDAHAIARVGVHAR